jgi:molybdate transport system substrate-binding protein
MIGSTMRSVLATIMTLLLATNAQSAEIGVLSAGAVEPGLVAAAAVFGEETSHSVKISYAPAPALRQRVGAGELHDILIAPPAVLDDLAKLGRIGAQAPVLLGRVGISVVVREGAPVPEVATVEAVKRAVLEAESVVFNKASTGLYLEKLFARLGVLEQIAGKSTRPDRGEAVAEHIIAGKGREVGFGATTEMTRHLGKGLRIVAPLPAEMQNYTSYAAVAFPAAVNRAEVQAFLDFLRTRGKPIMVANGVE